MTECHTANLQIAAMEMTECVQPQSARYSLPPKEGAANTSQL